MKKGFIFIMVAATFFASCTSPKNTTTAPSTQNETVIETVAVEQPEEKQPVDSVKSEYERSIKQMEGTVVTLDEFQRTKKDILQVIAELNKIIKNKDYESWLDYLSPDTKEYWSDPVNLANVATRLPVKGIKIRNLKDYFNYVFIPARQNSRVEEIRYLSKNTVKAVQPMEKEDLIFYTFENNGENWLLVLDKN
ncbi:MAG: hypothetical protein J6T84_00880 [Spirochaetaceae bacterium]|nr:hypothetical protein [Spirochaetaceae bacterium]